MEARPTPLRNRLRQHTRPGELWSNEKGNGVRCVACGHRCFIPAGHEGICKVRYNDAGTLRVPWGYTAGIQIDPIEKKPFFHVLPGSKALSFGMLGCDFHCGYCQNWMTSQTLRDSEATATPLPTTAAELCELATRNGAQILTSTYNEPLITSEWAVEIFKEGKKHGLITSFVSNGNATPEVLAFIRPHVDLYKIDLKGFRDKSYRQLGGVLKNVLDSIENVHRMGFFLEVVTLLVPGFNDGEEEIRDMARFLAAISPDIPWHVSAFHQDYKMREPQNTPATILERACEMGRENGLNFVYAGNLPGQVSGWENTCCPQCHKIVIERSGFRVRSLHLDEGCCKYCRRAIPGIWK